MATRIDPQDVLKLFLQARETLEGGASNSGEVAEELLQEVAKQARAFLTQKQELPHVVIFVDGGLVQEVIADQNIHYTIFDQDTDGAEDVETIRPFGEGDPFPAFITDLSTASAPDRVKHYADQIPSE